MSRSGSSSNTKTKTYPRLELVIMQFRRLIRRVGVETTDEYVEKLCDALRQGWIQSVLIYGFDKAQRAHVEVSLKVDWNEHDRQLSRGSVTVSVDPDIWRDDLAVEIESMIMVFNQAKTRDALTVKWRINLTSRVYANANLKAQVYRELELADAEPVKWASTSIDSDSMNIEELSELTASIRYSR